MYMFMFLQWLDGWLRVVWEIISGELLRKPSLLIWDQFRVHGKESTKKFGCFDVRDSAYS